MPAPLPSYSTAEPSQRMTAREYRLHMGLPVEEGRRQEAGGRSGESKAQIRMPKRAKQNAGEREFMALLVFENPGAVVLFEPFALILPSGTRYTPDLVVVRGREVVLVCEVKGRRIHNGHSIRAFKEAVAAFPFWKFVFAQKREGGWVRTESAAENN